MGSYRSVAAAILVLEYQGSGKIHAVVQEENMAAQTLDLDGYTGIAQFGAGRMPFVGKDWRHPPKHFPLRPSPRKNAGEGW